MIKYRAFIEVVETGSITKAAKNLGYSQPGISYMIDSLEKEIGFPLLVRGKDSVQPTKDGARILYHCKQIVNNEDDLKETAKAINGLMEGTIYVASQNSMLVNVVPHIISRFSKSFSGITVNLAELPYGDFASSLQSGDIDLGFMSEQKLKGFEFHPLFNDPVCLIMHKDHPFTRYDEIPVPVLNGCDFIMPIASWDDTVKIVLDKDTFTPKVKYEVASDTAAIALTAENQGVYIMSNLQTSLLPNNVVHRPIEGSYHRTMGYMIKSLKNATPALTEFIKTTEHVVAEYLKDEAGLLLPVKQD